MQLLYPALLALLTFTTPSLSTKKPKDAILLSSVKTLTLRSNALTSHRRVSAIPQLKCVGPACKHHAVERMRCTNQGSSYNEEDIEWSCTADMPEDFKLGSTEVTCEGYTSRDDPYILKGSCGVEYRLLLTEQGEERFGKSGSSWTGSGDGAGGSKFGTALFMLVFLGVFFWILYSAWRAIPEGGIPRQPRRGWGGGGWGGGGWGPGGGDPYDPPPPYPGKRYSTQQEGWRPGFWSGAAAGAAGGYMAGNRGNRQQEPRGSSWFGGNSGGGFNNPSPGRSSSGSSSSARHSSTGFGSTSRR
ncbi:transmembrane protein-like protein 66 [Leptodontidium sp. MPI-SDFR-AT-0119]|nr:transmembrane protein-like protein 66 [Leptodontidium sp. MPI-SDFR-AT-0119]